MWARGVVVPPPGFDQDFRLAQIKEDFPRQQLVSELGVEALAVSIFPRRTGFDIECLHADALEPLAQGGGDELGAIVGTDMLRRAMMHEQFAQRVEHITGVELALDADRQALPGELIDYAQHAEHLAVMGAILDEIVRPDMALGRRSKPHARTVIQP